MGVALEIGTVSCFFDEADEAIRDDFVQRMGLGLVRIDHVDDFGTVEDLRFFFAVFEASFCLPNFDFSSWHEYDIKFLSANASFRVASALLSNIHPPLCSTPAWFLHAPRPQ